MMILIWLGLFVATALTDYLSAKWVDSGSPKRRAHISAIHEAVGFAAGFTVYAWQHDIWMILPCVAGAWVGSYFAGVEDAVDPHLIEAIHDAVELVLDREDARRIGRGWQESSHSSLPCE